MQSRLKIIDIGHSGYSLDKAISELEYNVNLCLENGNFRAIKVIHGHGTGALKKRSVNGAIIMREDFNQLFTAKTMIFLTKIQLK